MPVAPAAYKVRCQACGWVKRVYPKSDVFNPNDWIAICPECGSKNLTKTPIVSGSLGRLGQLLSVLKR